MVECGNSKCHERWFHLKCAGLQRAPNGQFFCSDECKSAPGWIHCCGERRPLSTVVRCRLKDDCRKQQYYHVDCLSDNQQTGT